MTVREALQAGTARLAAAGVEDPWREARRLLGHAMGLDQATLLLTPDAAAPPGFGPLLDRRAAREPLALIVGRQGFWTLDLAVSTATLIPRADSETLIEAALAARRSVGSVLDLGTGTGCLLLAALSAYPGAWGIGVDRAPAAAALARGNARALGFSDRASILCGDWATALAGRFDLVLSNPPYIETDAIARLMPEVAAYEPQLALDGGTDGLDGYRALLRTLPDLLAPGGLAVFELGCGQAPAVGALARAAGFRCTLRNDLGGVPRALLLERPDRRKGLGINASGD